MPPQPTPIIEGDLNSADLASVVQMLTSGRREGILAVDSGEEDGRRKYVVFGPVGITILMPQERLDLAMSQALLRARKLTSEKARDLKKQAADRAIPLLDVLSEEGLVEDRLAESTYLSLLEEEMIELFSWEKAKFQFHSNATAEDFGPDAGIVVPCLVSEVDKLLLEAARRTDEWALIRRTIDSPNEIYRAVGRVAPRAEQLGGEPGRVVFGLIDGQRNLEEITEASFQSRFDVSRTVAHFIEQGIVVPLSREEIEAHGDEALRRGRLREAQKFYLRAIEKAADGIPDLHNKAGRVAESLKDFPAAAAHLRIVATSLEETGAFDRAYEVYRKIAKLLPKDLAAREKLIEIYVNHRGTLKTQSFDVIPEGMSLAARYLQKGEPERAVVVLRKVAVLEENNLNLRAQLVNACLKCGDNEGALREYEGLARIFTQRGNLAAALKVYEKILSLDPSSKEAIEQKRFIEARIVEARKNLRRRNRSLRALLLAAGLAGIVTVYEASARQAFESLAPSRSSATTDLLARVETLQSFRDRYPFSRSSSAARREAALLEDRVEEERWRVVESQRRRRAEVSALYRRAQATVEAGRLEEGLERLRELWASTEDRAFLRSERVGEKITSIEEYLKQSGSLREAAQSLLAQNDVRGASEAVRRLREEYPLSPEAASLRMPVLLASDPPGAIVRVDGAATGLLTPAVLEAPRGGALSIELELPGHYSERREFDGEPSWFQSFELVRKPTASLRTEGPFTAPPVASDGVTFAANRASEVIALPFGATEPAWRKRLGALADVESGVAVGGGLVYAAAHDGRLHALRRSDGAEAWSARLQGFVRRTPVVGPRGVALVEDGGRLVHVDVAGETSWRRELPDTPLDVAFVGDRLHAVFPSGAWLVLDAATGATAEERRAPGLCPATTVAFGSGLVVFGTGDGAVEAASIDSGRSLFRQTLGARVVGLAISGDSVLAATAAGRLVAVDVRTGREFRACDLGFVPSRSPLAAGRSVLVASGDGMVLCLDAASLAPRWRGRIGAAVAGMAVLDGGRLLVAGEDGSLSYFDETVSVGQSGG